MMLVVLFDVRVNNIVYCILMDLFFVAPAININSDLFCGRARRYDHLAFWSGTDASFGRGFGIGQ